MDLFLRCLAALERPETTKEEFAKLLYETAPVQLNVWIEMAAEEGVKPVATKVKELWQRVEALKAKYGSPE